MPSLIVMFTVILPGAVAWIAGRSVRAAPRDSVQATRMARTLRRLNLLWAACVFLIVFVQPQWSIVYAVLSFVGLLAGWFPTRRDVRDETWGLASYVWFTLRLLAWLVGPMFLLALAPLIVSVQSLPLHVASAGLVAIVVLLCRRYAAQTFILLFRPRPIADAELNARFATIAARAKRAVVPALSGGPVGGVWPATFALPAPRLPRVFFSRTMLERLSPEELTALYAGELAVLEHGTPARLRLAFAYHLAAVLLAVGVMPLAPPQLQWLWSLLVVAAWIDLVRRAGMRKLAHDRRAVELLGDGTALIAALTKASDLERQPRQLDVTMEQRALVPSLARRIEAIRTAARPAEPYRSPADAPAQPVVLRGEAPGSYVILDHDRAHWLNVAPTDASDDAATLKARAHNGRIATYSDLTSLCLSGTAQRPVLCATDRQGQHWNVVLRAEDLPAAQAALARLPPSLSASAVALPTTVRVLPPFAAAIALCALSVPALAAAIIAIARRGPVALAALGGAFLAIGVLPASATMQDYPAIRWLALGLGTAFVVAAHWYWRVAPAMRSRGARTTLYVIGGLLALELLLWGEALGLSPTLLSLHATAERYSGLAVSALAFAAALALGRRRVATVGAIASLLCFVVGAGAATSGFRARWCTDPLLIHAAPAPIRHVTPQPIMERQLDVQLSSFRLSPSGTAFLGRAGYVGDDEDGDPPPQRRKHRPGPLRFVASSFAGAPLTVVAEDVAFIDDETLLVVNREDESHLALSTTAVGGVVAAGAPAWRLSVPRLDSPRVTVDGKHWRIVGTTSRFSTSILEGTIGSADSSLFEWQPTQRRPLLIKSSTVALRAEHVFGTSAVAMLASGLGAASHSWLSLVDEPNRHEIDLGTSMLFAYCDVLSGDHADFACAAEEARATNLWLIAHGRLEPVALLPPQVRPVDSALRDGRLLLTSRHGDLVVDTRSHEVTALDVAEEGRCFMHDAAGSRWAEACAAPQGSRVRLFELPAR